MSQQKQTSFLTPWFIWGLAAFFFFSHYVVRVTPGHISEELQIVFETTKFELGLLGTSFYIPYVLMQMPVGYLVDRFGSRLLLTIAVLICSVSSFIFANSEVIGSAMISRILLGFCSATAFIGALKLITVWFEARKLALLVGITQALGMVGAALGGHLVPFLNDEIGWQDTFRLYGVVFFVLSLLIYSVVRNSPKGNQVTATTPVKSTISLSQLKKVIFSKFTWINALYAGLIYAPTDVLGEFWGKEFLKNIHQLDTYQASSAVSYLFFGWAIGGPLAGWLADHVGRRPVMIGSALFGFILLPIVFYVPSLPLYLISIIMFIYGLTNTGLIASYTAAGELHDKSLGGFSMAIANMFSVLLGAALMPILGMLLDWSAQKHPTFTAVGDLLHNAQDYKNATYIISLCLFLAVVSSLFTKETLTAQKETL
ncbi:MAG: MFS transporter [Proteobacteria bacterium]|nr:MFS transporter [Pseudomonadota bacterium]